MSLPGSNLRIVIGSDGSADSELALDWAVRLVQEHEGGELHLIEALALPPIPTQAWLKPPVELLALAETEARERIEGRAEKLGQRGVTATAHVRRWLPVDSIVELAGEVAADLVVVGRRGNSPGRFWIGSVSAAVSRQAPCPVVVVRDGELHVPPRTILLALDGSEPSRVAAQTAARLFPGVPAIVACARPTAEGLEAHAIESELEATTFPLDAISVEILDDDPAAAILAIAEREGIDLITAGRRGRGPLRHLLFGSVAEKLLQLAPTSLLLAH